ncbi:rab3 GTPase-activating protein catalytic subunit [Anopheles arabiensis]|nr:rab3 GTPase-activating protein catalytic subunit [Anopheles arabiensis]
MLNEEVDDTEFFQQDFTTASDWELFNARLEEIFHEWKLSFGQTTFRKLAHHELASCRWNVARETIKFADVELQVVHYRAQLEPDRTEGSEPVEPVSGCQTFVDLLSIENDYCMAYGQRSDGDEDEQKLHPLAQWYGLREFVIVAPVKKSISNESRIRILMSSVHIAVSESSCDVPVFVQAMDKVQHVYLGVCESGPVRMSFDIVHLHLTPPTCKYLSGLLEVFKGKIGVAYVDPVAVSVRFTYQLARFVSGSFVSDKSVPFTEGWTGTDAVSLPFGVSIDPVSELIVHCTWPQVADNVVVDSQTYSDFDPLTAPLWSLRAQFEDTPVCYLADCLQEYLQISDSRRALTEYFSELAFGGNVPPIEGANPLDLLTESKIPRLSSVLPGRIVAPKAAPAKLEGPLNDEQLKDMLYYLFPDAQREPRWPYAASVTGPAEFDPLRIKSANADSLVHRLATLLALCNACFGGKRAVAQLWAEFAQEMRYRVERCIQIPGVASGFPDSRTCLLHQKLQMLNVCMERRTLRDGGLPFAMRSTGPTAAAAAPTDQSDEEFFDCSDDEQESGATGRLSRLGNMLLVSSDEPLYIPVTQEPVPKTEDQLEDDAEVMLKLGPGSELCTQMMSASLLSDMESFKAANPAGQLEDFIRWYSPRDWIEDEPVDEQDPFGRKGHLSARMLIPGNTWQTVWEGARAIPARRQKRLFDDTREAEKVLHFLESRTIGQIAQLTMATLFHVGVLTLTANATPERAVVPAFDELIDRMTAACCRLSRESWISGSGAASGPGRANSQTKYEQQLLTEMMQLECIVTQARSLRRKLFAAPGESSSVDAEKLLQGLLQSHETDLPEGASSAIAGRLMVLFAEAKRAANEQSDQQTKGGNTLPDPIEKQFTLRLSGNTVSKGAGTPQFLRAILMPQEFRLCGAFSRNTTFY